MIILPVIRIRATGRNPWRNALLVGGRSGTDQLGFQPPAGILARHDFVMVGYSGVDGSNVWIARR